MIGISLVTTTCSATLAWNDGTKVATFHNTTSLRSSTNSSISSSCIVCVVGSNGDECSSRLYCAVGCCQCRRCLLWHCLVENRACSVSEVWILWDRVLARFLCLFGVLAVAAYSLSIWGVVYSLWLADKPVDCLLWCLNAFGYCMRKRCYASAARRREQILPWLDLVRLGRDEASTTAPAHRGAA